MTRASGQLRPIVPKTGPPSLYEEFYEIFPPFKHKCVGVSTFYNYHRAGTKMIKAGVNDIINL